MHHTGLPAESGIDLGKRPADDREVCLDYHAIVLIAAARKVARMKPDVPVEFVAGSKTDAITGSPKARVHLTDGFPRRRLGAAVIGVVACRRHEERSPLSMRRRWGLLRARRDRPRNYRSTEQRDNLFPPCMSRKENGGGGRGPGHDRTPVATGSPQPPRKVCRE